AVPKDIAEVFTARHIGRSENLIYNALSTLVKQKKLKKQGGRYFATSIKSNAKSVAQQKQRISPQGLKRIVQANKRRWARHRAAQTTQMPAVSRLTRPRQKAVPPRKAVVKTIPLKRSTRKT
ncbi:MAG TPA: hypothetical protein VHZ55_21330, partial [Bryobacteraceae bacterium]|nr:hypothetical protein [Bryobacteraceae bacterium]